MTIKPFDLPGTEPDSRVQPILLAEQAGARKQRCRRRDDALALRRKGSNCDVQAGPGASPTCASGVR
jgi:hypothetical protein